MQQWEAFREDFKSMSAQLLLQTIEEVEEFIDRLERIAHEVPIILLYYVYIPRPHLVFNVVHSLRTLKFVAILNT